MLLPEREHIGVKNFLLAGMPAVSRPGFPPEAVDDVSAGIEAGRFKLIFVASPRSLPAFKLGLSLKLQGRLPGPHHPRCAGAGHHSVWKDRSAGFCRAVPSAPETPV